MKETNEIKKEVKIEYHADDFGLFPAQSQRILDCHTNGMLNGISIMPNGFCLDACMKLLDTVQGNLDITVHLNIIEGRALSKAEEVRLLTNEKGVFSVSFANLLMHSYLPGKTAYRNQLKQEITAQIRAIQEYLPEGYPLRLDGHAHYHMIPVVFDAMMEVIEEENLDVSYIRIPQEKIFLYLKNPSIWKDLRLINLAKVAILNVLSIRNLQKYRERLSKMERKLFVGVFLSGQMYREKIQPILPDIVKQARKEDRNVEILAHPGGVYEEKDIAQLTCREDVEFLTSHARNEEAKLFA